MTFATMGTVVSVRICGGDGRADAAADAAPASARLDALDRMKNVFRRWDEQFSLYRPDSELSWVASGDIRLTDASGGLRACYALALGWRDRTLGVFTPHRSDEVIDLSGVVKALAIDEAGAALCSSGFRDWSINAGGDVLVSGAPEDRIEVWEPTSFRQVSVFAADIVTADALATSIVAGGEAALHDLTARFAVDVLAVLPGGQLLTTPGLRRVE
jgi:thiamine biosynthesis lipoprotein